MYLAAIYGHDMQLEVALNVVYVRMWEKGHTFQEIRDMDLEDLGLVIGYWHEKGRIDAKRQRVKKNAQRKRKH